MSKIRLQKNGLKNDFVKKHACKLKREHRNYQFKNMFLEGNGNYISKIHIFLKSYIFKPIKPSEIKT